MKNHNFWWVNQLQMAIFNSYVILPKGRRIRVAQKSKWFEATPWKSPFWQGIRWSWRNCPFVPAAPRFDWWNASNCLVQTLRGVADPSRGSLAMFLAPFGGTFFSARLWMRPPGPHRDMISIDLTISVWFPVVKWSLLDTWRMRT